MKNYFKKKIDFEESMKDPEEYNASNEISIHTDQQRIRIAMIFFLFIFGVFFARLFSMQIMQGGKYFTLAEQNRIEREIIPPVRGIIFDRDSVELANNSASFQLIFQPSLLEKKENIWASLSDSLNDLGYPPGEDEQMIKKIHYVLDNNLKEGVLIKNIDHEKALDIFTKVSEKKYLRLVPSSKRHYPFNFLSHVLGYVGNITSQEYEKLRDEKYYLSDIIGKDGIEKSFESYLRGAVGVNEYEVDVYGKRVNLVSTQMPTQGDNVYLTIDSKLAEKIHSTFIHFTQTRGLDVKGAVIFEEVDSGKILAMDSFPSFSSEDFITRDPEILSTYFNDENFPLLNRGISGEYASGSTIKPFIASAGLQEKVITSATTFNCGASIQVRNQYDPGIVYTFPDWKTHGVTDVRKAIAWSSNVFFYLVSGGEQGEGGLGIDRIEKYLKLFGFGSRLGINLPGEREGLIPNREWKEKVKGERWYVGDTYHVGIGQGDISVTPLQLVGGVAEIANNGSLMRPQLVEKITNIKNFSKQEFKPQVIRKDFIDPYNLQVVREGMRRAVTEGSARSLNSLSVSVAGKTGTAQFGSEGKTHSWFTGFYPFENPKVAFVVLVEGGGGGDEVALPIAREILEWEFGRE